MRNRALMMRNRALIGASVCMVLFTLLSAAHAEDLMGRVLTATTNDGNRCVFKPAQQLSDLSYVGDPMAARVPYDSFPNFPVVSFTDPMFNHWQSIARLMRPENSHYVVLTRSLSLSSGYSGKNDMAVVSIGWHAGEPSSGHRLRSNVLFPNSDLIFETSVPDEYMEADHKVSGGLGLVGTYDHAGGMQAIGDYVMVALESPNHDLSAHAVLVDFTSPLAPQTISALDLTTATGAGPIRAVGGAAIVKLSDDTYLLAVHPYDDPDPVSKNSIRFYKSTGTSLCRPNANGVCQGPEFTYLSMLDIPWDPQNIALITECTDGPAGPLHLWLGGNGDHMEMWSLHVPSDGSSPTYNVESTRTVYCYFDVRAIDNIKWCNFDAASGTYVDPDGRLLVYASVHDADPDIHPMSTPNVGKIWMMEFRSRLYPNGTLSVQNAFPQISADISGYNEAWVELFVDEWFNDGDNNELSLMIDYLDRSKENYDDFTQITIDHAGDFNDQVSSMRWGLPVGLEFVLYKDAGYMTELLRLGPSYVKFFGVTYPYGSGINLSGGDLNDQISSARFVSTGTTAEGMLRTVENLDLPPEVKNSYLANLKKARDFVSEGRIIPAINQVEAFIHKVESDIDHEKIDSHLGVRLIELAELLVQRLQEGKFEEE